MELTGRKAIAIAIDKKVEIITEPFMSNGWFVIGVMFENGQLGQTTIDDLKLLLKESCEVVDHNPISYIGRKAITEEGLEVEIIEEPRYVPIDNEHHVLVIEEGRIQSDILERLKLLD